MKGKIKLYNRDGADLWLECTHKEVQPNIFIWELTVDLEHSYVLEHCRMVGTTNGIGGNKVDWSVIEAIDPAGGPFISLGDEFENKYKIVKINSAKDIWISERNNN